MATFQPLLSSLVCLKELEKFFLNRTNFHFNLNLLHANNYIFLKNISYLKRDFVCDKFKRRNPIGRKSQDTQDFKLNIFF